MKHKLKKLICCVIAMTFLLSVNVAFAAETDKDDKERFEQTFDDFMKEALQKHNVPGVTLSVVKDGEIYFNKGYGFSDIENKVPVNAAETLFRIGSVTKLFTVTSSLQLVEQDKLDLNEEVNKYLEDFKIKYYQGKPIKIKHLLTHTGGFDERASNILSPEVKDDLLDLGGFLKKEMPGTFREPGTIMQYSNHGMTLLGHIVENVSDKRIDKVIESEIFDKLNMEDSYYRYTDDLEKETSKGYLYTDPQYEEMEPSEVLTHPAGSIVSTANDMAKFLMWQLDGGSIVKDETLNMMQQTQFTHQEEMLGNAYGFYEVLRKNYKVMEHAGDTSDFSSLLSMHPEQKLGFFISTNSNLGGQMLREEFANKFYEYFLGEGPLRASDYTVEGASEAINITDYEGVYRYGRIPQTSPLKLLNPLLGRLTVKQIDENTIRLKDDVEEVIYDKIDGNLFQNKADDSLLVLEKDSEGRLYMVKERYPMLGLVTGMLGTYEKMDKGSVMIENSVVIPLIVAIIYLITMLIGYFRKNKRKYTGTELTAKLLMVVTSMMILIESGIFGWMIIKVINNGFDFNGIYMTINVISVLFIGLTIITTIYTCKAWKQKYWSLKGRIFHTLVNIAALLMVISIVYMNGLNFSYWL